MTKISFIIPCYNEEENVSLMFKEIVDTFKNTNNSIEMIFIDDGSTDNTSLELLKLKKEKINKVNVKKLTFSRNFGKDAAIYAGFQNSTGGYVVIIDADLQQKPSLVLKMLDFLEKNKNYDCVCYYQQGRIENKFISSLKMVFYKMMAKVTNIEFVNGASDFRMFRKQMVNAILKLSEKNRFSKGLFSWVGFKTKYMPYTPEKRINGKSKFSIIKLFNYGISGVLSFSIIPLRFSTICGLLFSGISFIYLLVVLIQKIFFTIEVPGYATLIACILLIGGIILLCLGIIGEYIARIYIEVKNRPIYILKNDEENKNEENK